MVLSRSASSSRRVRDFLEEQTKVAGLSAQLPPIRHIARELNISTATVHHVFRDLQREGKIQTAVGRGTFWTETAATKGRRYCFGMSVAQLEYASSPLAMRIFDAIFRASTTLEQRIVLQPLATSPVNLQEWEKQLLLHRDEVDGLIMMPFPRTTTESFRKSTEAFESLGKPVIAINPFEPHITQNFVSADLLGASQRIGRAFGRAGRRRVLLVLHTSLQSSPTFAPRLMGLQLGMSEAGAHPTETVRVTFARNVTEEAGYEIMQRELDQPPDAIYCMGDFLALGAITALREAGLCVPEDVSVIGGTGLDFPGKQPFKLTQFCHPVDAMAENILRMLVERVENDGRDLPGRYIPASFRLGDTTEEAENRILGESLDPK